jgi:hypothetical protein
MDWVSAASSLHRLGEEGLRGRLDAGGISLIMMRG